MALSAPWSKVGLLVMPYLASAHKVFLKKEINVSSFLHFLFNLQMIYGLFQRHKKSICLLAQHSATLHVDKLEQCFLGVM
jgi:hypothetical protein